MEENEMKKTCKKLILLFALIFLVSNSNLTVFATNIETVSVGTSVSKLTGDAPLSMFKGIGEITKKIGKKELIKFLEEVERQEADNSGSEMAGKLLYHLRTKDDKVYIQNQQILEACATISRQIDDLSNKMDAQFAKMTKLLNQQVIDEIIREDIRPVEDDVNEAWDIYLDIQELLTVPEGQTQISDVNLTKAQQQSDRLVTLLSSWNFESMDKQINRAFTRGSASQSILDAQREVLKLENPFEHQIYNGMSDIYNYGFGMQMQLITLYSEYANAKKQDKPEIYANFIIEANTVSANLEKQATESKIMDLDVRGMTPQAFTLADGTAEDAYYVKQNTSGENFVILKKAFKLKDLIKSSKSSGATYFNYDEGKAKYDHSKDSQFYLPVDYKDLTGLFKGAGTSDTMSYLKSNGGLAIGSANLLFINGASAYHDVSLTHDYFDYKQPLVKARDFAPEATKSQKLEFMFSEIYSNEKSITYPQDASSTLYGDSTYLRIYVDKSYHPGGDGQVIQIIDKSELPNTFTISDGVTLDLSKISGDMGGKKIVAAGNSKIIGGTEPYANLAIEIADGAKMTINSLNVTSISKTPGITAIGKSSLILENENKMIAKKDWLAMVDAVKVSANADLTILGAGSLYAEGNNAGSGIGGYGGGNITINGTNVTAIGSPSQDCWKASTPNYFGAGIGGRSGLSNNHNKYYYEYKGKITIINSNLNITSGLKGNIAMGNSENVGSTISGSTINLNGGKLENMTNTADALVTDVPQNQWYTPYVNRLIDKGIITKEDAKNYNGNKSVTHKEFATLLARLAGKDIKDYADMIKNPDDLVTRDEMVLFIQKYVAWSAKPKEDIVPPTTAPAIESTPEAVISPEVPAKAPEAVISPEVPANTPEAVDKTNDTEIQTKINEYFTDYPQVSEETKTELAKLWKEGVFSGMVDSNGKIVFNPKGEATNAQVAAVLSRIEPLLVTQK